MLGTMPRRYDRRVPKARQLSKDGDDDLALQLFDRVLELTPDDVDALQLRGDLLRRNKRGAEAIADFQRIIEVAPDSPWGHTLIARMAMQRGPYGQFYEHSLLSGLGHRS